MTDLNDDQIASLDSYIAQRFAARQVRFFHAENLRNFRTYCEARAVLCREDLMARDPDFFTRFRSDADDRRLDVLNRVFGNVYDFGAIFARAPQAVPNIYGPILLVFAPTVFSVMTDIRITPQSIATHLESWLQASITSTEQVDDLVGGDDFGSPISSSWYYCELSCANRSLPFPFLEEIIVEPISVGGLRLVDLVRAEAGAHGVRTLIRERHFRSDANADALRELVGTCEALTPGLSDSQWSFDTTNLPACFHDYPTERRGRAVGWCRYFYFGTVEEIRRDSTSNSEETEYEPPVHECMCGALKDTLDYECLDCGHHGSNTDPPEYVEDGAPFYSDARGESAQLECENCASLNLEVSYPEEYCSRCAYRISRDD